MAKKQGASATNPLDNIMGSLSTEMEDMVAFENTDAGMVLDWLPTMVPSLDSVLMGGLPLSGRVTEVFGEPSVGKSTFVMRLIATAQKLGIFPVYYDVEGTTNKDRLANLGVDPKRVGTLQPKVNKDGTVTPLTIETIIENMITVSSRVHKANPETPVLFIWDTVAQTQSNIQEQAGTGQQTMGQQARALSEGIRKLNVNLMANNASLIALNQARADINGNPFLKEMKTIGGNAWQHEMSLRLAMYRASKETVSTTDKTEIGHTVKLKFVKSKVGDNAGAMAEAVLLQRTGFDVEYNIFVEAVDKGLVKSGSWPTYTDDAGTEHKFQTKAKFIEFLNTEEGIPVATELWQKLIKIYFPECYPPLFNVYAIMTTEQYPYLAGLRDYYIGIQEALPDSQQHTQYRLWKKESANAK